MPETTDATEPAPPATETVTAGELNHRDRVLWLVDGRRENCRVAAVIPEKFADIVVAYRLHLTRPDGSPTSATVDPDEQLARIVEEP